MKYILYDNIKGTILGLNDIKIDDYLTLSDDAYEKILNNNGAAYVLIDKAQERINNNEEIIITLSEISTERRYDIISIINNIKRKNYSYCRRYIENGIRFEGKHYTYKLEDQVNYEQLIKLVNKNILTSNIPIKASGETEYMYVDKEFFIRLYNALIRHKFYNLFYLQALNKYIETLDDEITLHRLNYETALPKEYVNQVNELLNELNIEEGDIS